MTGPQGPVVQEIRTVLANLAERRGVEKSFCPSEAAKLLAPHDWRPLMVRVREVAAEMQAEGVLQATQGGVEVDLPDVRGPVRLGLPRGGR